MASGQLPPWITAAAVTVLGLWAVSIWAIATSTAESGVTDSVTADLMLVGNELGALSIRVDDLSEEVTALHTERTALLARIEQMEAASLPVAALPPVEDEAIADQVDEEDVTKHSLWTDGRDKYNCVHFTSFAEAQEALRVNRPGDPNRIDMNRNGVACEDFRYPDNPLIFPQAAAPSGGGQQGVESN